MKGCLHGHHISSKNVKIEYEEDGCYKKKTQNPAKNSWSDHHISTYLQKCHYGQQKHKKTTMGPKCWPNDVDMRNDMAQMWQ